MNNLTNIGVLVTRPREQNQALTRLLEQEGANVITFPALHIGPTQEQDALAAILTKLGNFDWAIFISPNAVHYGLEAIKDKYGELPSHLKLATVGLGSTRALAEAGLQATVTPRDQFNSEGLLAQPTMEEVSGEKILIFRGSGGREILRQTLMERGAEVHYAECYERSMPKTDTTELLSALETDIDVVTLTSGDAARYLWQLAGISGQESLHRLPVTVISPRLKHVCREIGYEGDIVIAESASDEAIVQALQTWRHR